MARVKFIDESGGGSGVRLRKRERPKKKDTAGLAGLA
jgi:hypothetical protein